MYEIKNDFAYNFNLLRIVLQPRFVLQSRIVMSNDIFFHDKIVLHELLFEEIR